MHRRSSFSLLFVVLFAVSAFADDARTARLETLCRVWAEAKYLHPAMLTQPIDWDGALVRAVPRVRAATTTAELAAAIDGMLKELGDPATRVVSQRAATKHEVELLHQNADVLTIEAGPYIDAFGAEGLYSRERDVAAAFAKASTVVVNLTRITDDPDAADVIDRLGLLGWTTEDIPVPGRWTAYHSGYMPQVGGTSGGYFSSLMLVASKPLPAAKTAPKKITFMTDGAFPLPAFAVALQRAGKATIETSSPTDAASIVRIDLGDGHAANIRTATFAADGGTKPAVTPIVESRYAEMTAPDLPHRLLAAFRVWSVIHYFYPYRDLIGDWDGVLREFIPRFESAEDADAYAAAVLEMTAHIYDGHVGARGHPSIAKFIPPWFVPFEMQRIDDQFVVVDKFDPQLPIGIGDVVVTVDGEPLDARIKRVWPYVTGSTELTRIEYAASVALRGPAKSVAQLGVRGADGKTHTVAVPRVGFYKPPESKEAPYRVLDGNIGYVDLRTLEPPQVDAMFDALMKTKATIFDMRGYPNATAWSIAPRINTRHAKYFASFQRPIVTGVTTAEEKSSASYRFDQTLPPATKPLYTGRVVVLIDDRAISQAEHTCLFFEQAAGAKFIGRPTAGANGDVTRFVLPGGFVVSFSGNGVRHVDGRQLQRVGIQPDIRVEPTIAGLQAGKDEVLDRAIAFVK